MGEQPEIRKILFRAWNESDGIMYHADEDFIFVVNSDGSMIYRHWLYHPGYCTWKTNEPDKPMENQYNIKAMQFTGLKDKNGKDIYEGDIMGYEDDPTKMVICWAKFGWGYKIYGQGKLIVALSDFEIQEAEVLGNIYQNPELIEK